MKKWVYNTLIILLAAVFLVSAGALILYYVEGRQQENRYAALAELKNSSTEPPPTATDDPGPTDESNPTSESQLTEVTDPETGKTVQLLPEFAQLYLLNNDIVGWLTIPGTGIDYPVMQTPNAPDYYLKRNFDRESSSRGCLYAREVCDVLTPSNNITIYGHRMRDGSMFAQLDKYMDADFCRENPYITFDVLNEKRTYQILSVFLTTASQGEGFAYHMFVDAISQEDFDTFVTTCKDLALYDTGVEATYGDSFITLSTCEYSQTNGRLVVVAKRVE